MHLRGAYLYLHRRSLSLGIFVFLEPRKPALSLRPPIPQITETSHEWLGGLHLLLERGLFDPLSFNLMLVLPLLESLDLSQIRAEDDSLDLIMLQAGSSHRLDLLPQDCALKSKAIRHLIPEGFSRLLYAFIALEDIHGSDGS